jgi:hypothetical protein
MARRLTRATRSKKTAAPDQKSTWGLSMPDSAIKPLGLSSVVRRISTDAARLHRAFWAFTTRRVPQGAASAVLPLLGAPRAGDLVLARVDALCHHDGLQLTNGRRRQLFVGDEIVVAYGNRYASSQFEALVPETLGPCHLAAGGGIAARAVLWHDKISKGPTQITPIGLIGNANGERINLRDYAIYPVDEIAETHPTTLAVVGTGMDSGKTQTAAFTARGLIAAGLRVAYAKVTGTGAGGDYWLLRDAGANPVLDFTDVGMATTYMASHEEIQAGLVTLIGHIAEEGVDAIILEIADGVLQRETAQLLPSAIFRRYVGGILLAAQDSMGACAGFNWLKERPTPPVIALSGLLCAAPLQAREAKLALGLPVYNRQELATPSIAMDILARAQEQNLAIA